MKKLSVRAAVAAAFAIGVFCAAAAVQTNQWVGAVEGGSWSTLTNWKVLPDGGNPEGTGFDRTVTTERAGRTLTLEPQHGFYLEVGSNGMCTETVGF